MTSQWNQARRQWAVGSRGYPPEGGTTRPASSGVLEGKRILIAEGFPSLALFIYEILTEVGCDIIGPAATSKLAAKLVAETRVDAALLDIGLGDGPSFSVAEFLAGRGVPFAFLTGYDATDIPLQLRDHPILNKPMSFDRLLNVVRALCSPAREQTHYATTTHLSALPDAPDQDRTNTT